MSNMVPVHGTRFKQIKFHTHAYIPLRAGYNMLLLISILGLLIVKSDSVGGLNTASELERASEVEQLKYKVKILKQKLSSQKTTGRLVFHCSFLLYNMFIEIKGRIELHHHQYLAFNSFI